MERKIAALFPVVVLPSGERRFVDRELAGEDARNVIALIEKHGFEGKTDIVNRGLEGIRINDPQGKGYHRDYYVRWAQEGEEVHLKGESPLEGVPPWRSD